MNTVSILFIQTWSNKNKWYILIKLPGYWHTGLDLMDRFLNSLNQASFMCFNLSFLYEPFCKKKTRFQTKIAVGTISIHIVSWKNCRGTIPTKIVGGLYLLKFWYYPADKYVPRR